jgi:hypothetical protein
VGAWGDPTALQDRIRGRGDGADQVRDLTSAGFRKRRGMGREGFSDRPLCDCVQPRCRHDLPSRRWRR